MLYCGQKLRKGDVTVKKKTWILVITAIVAFFVALCAAWAFIHRRVIRAAIRREPYPACPHWLPGCLREKLVATEATEE